MRAAVLLGHDRPLHIETLRIPTLSNGQVLVKMLFSGVCHSQLMEVRGKRGVDKFLPHLLGHEGVGIVEAVGPGVTKICRGDRVVLGWIKGNGLDGGGCVYENENGLRINSGGVTTFSTQTVVSENRLVKLPDDIPNQAGVLFGCAIPTGMGIVEKELNPKPGSTFAVFGLGGIGLCALAAVMTREPKLVIAVDVEDSKLQIARKWGVHHVINARETEPVKAIRELTGNLGVDFAIEASGKARVIEQGFDSIKRQSGICLFASHPEASERISLDPFELICGKQIRGSWGGGIQPDQDLPRFFDMYRKGVLKIDDLLSRPYRLEEINEALNDLESRKINRAIIDLTEK